MIDIREEGWAGNATELAPLFLQQHHELSDPKHIAKLPLDVDWDAYGRLEKNGNLLLIVARQGLKIIGYTISIIHPHLHYRTALMCQVDTYWLAPDYRDPGEDSLDTLDSVGAQLLIETEDAAVRRGAVKMINHTRFWKDNQRLFDLLGFAEVERLSTKWIGR